MRYFPKKIEAKWQKKWLTAGVYESDLLRAKKPFYNLMMFPYPSAEGLHIGGMRTFTGVDIYGRLKRMQGFDVFEPIGLDGFGIHSENYAIKIGAHPVAVSRKTEKNFYRQLLAMGNGFAWKSRLETYDPEYYRWTQWIFIQLFRAGLAYRKKALVNWCPSCKTVLADEQAVAGECERCGSMIQKRDLEQWFFRITQYADRLHSNLDALDWSENIKVAQKNWIGKSEGATIKFKVISLKFKDHEEHIEVFTTRPDTLFGVTFLAVSPEFAKKWVEKGWNPPHVVRQYIEESAVKKDEERAKEGVEKSGVDSLVRAVNPANGEVIPVWIADYVLGGVGTGAIMAVPAHDSRDWEFAKKFNLPIKMVVCPHYPAPTCPVLEGAYEGAGHLVDSGIFTGRKNDEVLWEIVDMVGGTRKTNFRLRDWLISRQRYWGPPIPMIYCHECAQNGKGSRDDMPGWYPVLESELPVPLPYIKEFRPTGSGVSPLANVPKFFKTKCPACKSSARRETDVSDTFLDSAWYYLRYPSVGERKRPWNAALIKKWLPVHMYIGGAEHAVLHLLYVRFLAMVFKDIGLTNFEEPFKKFRSHGLVTKDGAKMSKSKGNVVSPDDYIGAFGADAMRMYLAFLAPFDQGGDFRDNGIRGITRFLERVWKFADAIGKQKKQKVKKDEITIRLLHKTIKKVGEDIEHLQYNTAISALMVLLNQYEAHGESAGSDDLKIFLKLLAPLAPHMSEELWQQHFTEKRFRSIHKEKWPVYDLALIRENTFELVVQVNGKVRGRVHLNVGVTQKEAESAAMHIEGMFMHLSREVKKIIFVQDKLINFVV